MVKGRKVSYDWRDNPVFSGLSGVAAKTSRARLQGSPSTLDVVCQPASMNVSKSKHLGGSGQHVLNICFKKCPALRH